MKLKKEYTIGLTIVIVLAIFIWGLNFIKGKNLFKKYEYYYAIFDDVQGLSVANAVYYNGFKVGAVKDIQFTDDNTGNLIVSLSLDKGIELPNIPKAIIYTTDLLGSKAIKLAPCVKGETCEPGDTIATEVEDIVASLESYAVPIQKQVEDILSNLDKLLIAVNDSAFKENLRNSVNNLSYISNDLKNELPTLISNTNESIKSIENLSNNLNNKTSNIDQTINNLNTITDSLKHVKFNETLQLTNKALISINQLLAKVDNNGNSKELIEQDSLYIHLLMVTKDLDSLINDINENPKKYVKFSLF